MISIESLTLRFGLGCFETIKVYPNGQIVFLDEHIKRLLSGIDLLNLSPSPSPTSGEGSINTFNKESINQSFKEEIIDFVKQNISPQTQVLRLIYTEETGLRYFLQDYKEKDYPLNLMISKDWRIDSTCTLNKFKSFNYLKNHLAFQDAQKQGFSDAILLNEKGEIAESSRANIFFKTKNGEWGTPNLESGCLPGVIREKLISKLKASEKTIKLLELKDFENCFVCNSLIEIQPVEKIEDIELKAFDTMELKDYLKKMSV